MNSRVGIGGCRRGLSTNQPGSKRLTRFELVAANCWSETFDLAKSVKDINQRIEGRTDFGKVEPITFIQAMSLIAFGA
jgi:hypothetical protein